MRHHQYTNARDGQGAERNARRNLRKEGYWKHRCPEILGRIQPENPREVQPESPKLSNGEEPSEIRHGKCPFVNN